MENITQTINSKFNNNFGTYVPGEFLPIFEGDQLLNQSDFYQYKAGKAAEAIGQMIVKTARVSAHVGSVVANHFTSGAYMS